MSVNRTGTVGPKQKLAYSATLVQASQEAAALTGQHLAQVMAHEKIFHSNGNLAVARGT